MSSFVERPPLQSENLNSQHNGQAQHASTHHRSSIRLGNARDRRRPNGHAAPASRRRRVAGTTSRVAGRSGGDRRLAGRARGNAVSSRRTLGDSDRSGRLDERLKAAGGGRISSLDDRADQRRLSDFRVLREFDTAGSHRRGRCRHRAHSGIPRDRLSRHLVSWAVDHSRGARSDGVDSGRVHGAGRPRLGSLRGHCRRGGLGCFADRANGGVQSDCLRRHIPSGWAVGDIGWALGNGVHRRGIDNACRQGGRRGDGRGRQS